MLVVLYAYVGELLQVFRMIYNTQRRGLAELLIPKDRQCEGLGAG